HLNLMLIKNLIEEIVCLINIIIVTAHKSITINRKSTVVIALAASLVVLLSACSQKEKEKEQVKTEQPKAVNYKAAPVQFINPEYEISVPAELKPYELYLQRLRALCKKCMLTVATGFAKDSF